jgi:hypothetical protein
METHRMRRIVQAVLAVGLCASMAACVGVAQTAADGDLLKNKALTVWLISDKPAVESARRQLQAALDDKFPDNQIDFTLVDPEDFQDDLKAVVGTEDFPDVVFLLEPAAWWGRMGLGIHVLSDPLNGGFLPVTRRPLDQMGDWQILRVAPHPLVARAFISWLADRDWPQEEPSTDRPEHSVPGAGDVALQAVIETLAGRKIDSMADPDMADFDARTARARALGLAERSTEAGANLQTGVTVVKANDRLAVALVRTRVDSAWDFGIVHSMVILRRGREGWKVLQLTPAGSPALMTPRFRELESVCRTVPSDQIAKLGGVSLASPPDGDHRDGPFELWWDNGGNASLLLVEWQQPIGWASTNLYFLPDRHPRDTTRVPSPFAASALNWRVWALGTGGVVTLSPWRSMR